MKLIRQADAARMVGVTPNALNMAIHRGQLASYEKYGMQLVSEAAVRRLWPDGLRKRGPKPKG